MLTRIRLHNFKCFSELDLQCGPLNLLCGMNGMGKSSVIQALLVLRQSFVAGEIQSDRIALGGELADLGTGSDVLFEDAEEEVVTFLLSGHGIPDWRVPFHYSRSADQLVKPPAVLSGWAARSPDALSSPWWNHTPFSDKLIYINAERIGPRKFHQRSETRGRRGEIGPRGEHAINFLAELHSGHTKDGAQRSPDRHLKDGDPRALNGRHRIVDVVDEWLQVVTPGAHLKMETVAAADAVIAGFTFDRPGDVDSRRFRATNVGFGLSYVLPVLLAYLAPAGSLRAGSVCLNKFQGSVKWISALIILPPGLAAAH